MLRDERTNRWMGNTSVYTWCVSTAVGCPPRYNTDLQSATGHWAATVTVAWVTTEFTGTNNPMKESIVNRKSSKVKIRIFTRRLLSCPKLPNRRLDLQSEHQRKVTAVDKYCYPIIKISSIILELRRNGRSFRLHSIPSPKLPPWIQLVYQDSRVPAVWLKYLVLQRELSLVPPPRPWKR